MKRDLIDHWNGHNLPEFLNRNGWDPRDFFVGEPSKIAIAWERELEWWGGPKDFQESWCKYRSSNFSFETLDLIKSFDQLASKISTEKKNILWSSNVWYNEFNFSSLGRDYAKAYKKWIRALAECDPDMLLLQAPETTLFCNKLIHLKTVSEIHKEIS